MHVWGGQAWNKYAIGISSLLTVTQTYTAINTNESRRGVTGGVVAQCYRPTARSSGPYRMEETIILAGRRRNSHERLQGAL